MKTELRSLLINLKVTPDEYVQIRELAKKRRLNMSQLIRKRVLGIAPPLRKKLGRIGNRKAS